MVNWFKRGRDRIVAPRLRARADSSTFTKVDLAELTPDREQFLGRAALAQLVLFEDLSVVVSTAASLASKERMTRAAATCLARHHALIAELDRTGADAAAAMQKHRDGVDYFQSATRGATWHETLMTAYITSGLLDDFFARLAGGLPTDTRTRVAAIYAGESIEPVLISELRLALENNPLLAARLALWGRRLVGDTILVARSSLAAQPSSASDEARIEPVFTEIITSHTRRMDALGLTA